MRRPNIILILGGCCPNVEGKKEKLTDKIRAIALSGDYSQQLDIVRDMSYKTFSVRWSNVQNQNKTVVRKKGKELLVHFEFRLIKMSICANYYNKCWTRNETNTLCLAICFITFDVLI